MLRSHTIAILATALAFAAPVRAENAGVTEQAGGIPEIKFGALTPKMDHRVPDLPAHQSESGSVTRMVSNEPPRIAVAPLIRFRARITAPVDARIAKTGDIVSAELLDTIMLPGGTMAGAGSPVIGEITDVQRSKTPLKADTSTRRWHDANGLLSMRIVKICGKSMIADVIPCPKTRVERGNAKQLALGVNARGDIVFRYSMAAYNAANLCLTGLGFAAGPVGWVVSPVVGGVAGAADPVLTYGRPLTERDTHTRLKGMAKGFAGGLPGGFIISRAINHGIDPALDVGDIVTFQERSQAKVQ